MNIATHNHQWKSFFVRTLAILIITLIISLAFNTFSPTAIPWSTDWNNHLLIQSQSKGLTPVSLQEVIPLVKPDAAVLIFDARDTSIYDQGHIPGAISTPVKDLNESLSTVQLMAKPTDKVLVYCTGHQCDESLRLGELLKQSGYQNVLIFLGGFDEWKAANQPIE